MSKPANDADLAAVTAELVAAGNTMKHLLQEARLYVEKVAADDAAAAILAARFAEADRRIQCANLEGRLRLPAHPGRLH